MKKKTQRKPTVLIADPDTALYEEFKTDPLAKSLTFEIVETGHEAQKLIKEKRGKYSACLISPELTSPSGFSVIKCSLMYQPTTPVYYIESLKGEVNFKLEEKELGISGMLAKPFDLKSLFKSLGGIVNTFDANDALNLAEENTDQVDEEVDDSDPNFRSIKASQFVSGSKSLFDIYVKLRADKYIKIIQAGDIFEAERVNSYINKGVSHFYLRKEALETYVSYCDKVTEAVSANPKVGLSQKFDFLFNQADVTLKNLADFGVEQESLAHAQKFLKNVCHLVSDITQSSDFLAKLIGQVKEFEHVGGVVMVAGMVAKKAGIESEKGIKELGLACFLHDIGLIAKVRGQGVYDEEEEKAFDEEEVIEKLASKRIFGDELNLLKGIWKDHAALGAEKLAEEQAVSEVVCQIIRQHHAHRDKEEGILPGGAIHPLAEILEICDEFIRLMNKISVGEIEKQYLVQRIMEIVSKFPRRTQEPFKQAIGLVP